CNLMFTEIVLSSKADQHIIRGDASRVFLDDPPGYLMTRHPVARRAVHVQAHEESRDGARCSVVAGVAGNDPEQAVVIELDLTGYGAGAANRLEVPTADFAQGIRTPATRRVRI